MRGQHVDVTELPFNKLVGLKLNDGRVVIDPHGHHANHVGTVHATAIYGAVEAASGQCLVQEFFDLAASGVVVLRTSTVKLRRPASLDAPLVATGVVEKDDAEKFRLQILNES
jgi:acyl-CoA thioesterase FadM